MTAPLIISGVFSRLCNFVVSSVFVSDVSTVFFCSESEPWSSFWVFLSFARLQLGLLFDITLGFLFGVLAGGFSEASFGDLIGYIKKYDTKDLCSIPI